MDHFTNQLSFPSLSGEQRKELVVDFQGGDLTSDGGLLLLGELERRVGLCFSLAGAVSDRRQPGKVRHSVEEVLRARVGAIAMGHVDGNDLNHLRHDPGHLLFSGLAPAKSSQSPGLASQSTLSRLENGVRPRDLLRMGMAFGRCVIGQLPADTWRITIDVDSTDDPCHGQQEFEGFNDYYGNHCYMPLLVHIVEENGRRWHIASLLRPGRVSGTKGFEAVVSRTIELLRERFPEIEIIIRCDSGFGGNDILTFCEKQDRDGQRVHYVIGLPQNRRLHRGAYRQEVDVCLRYSAEKNHWRTLSPAKQDPQNPDEDRECAEYRRFAHRAGTWQEPRWAVVKAGLAQGELNSRFVVTDLSPHEQSPRGRAWNSREIYWYYCQRGDQENRIKEWKLDLESGRTSCHRFLANQFRLLLHTAAGFLLNLLQALVPDTGRFRNPQVNTLRLHILKVAARVTVSCRRVCVHLASGYPYKDLWHMLSRAIAQRL